MNSETVRLGGLNCHVIDQRAQSDAPPKLVLVLCHGYGAPGSDLVGLAPELAARSPVLGESVRFVFPEAPLALDEVGLVGGRAWWPLDVARITAAIERGELRDLRNDLPDGLVQARQLLTTLVEELCETTGVPISRIVLGGFSQGAMLATDVALRLPESLAGRHGRFVREAGGPSGGQSEGGWTRPQASTGPAGLSIFSGTLLCESEWRSLAAQRGPMPVFQAHGREDPLLPFQAARWLHEMLTEAGLPVEFVEFRGEHTIGRIAVERCAAFLERLVRHGRFVREGGETSPS